MVGWYHRFNGHELGQTPRDGDGQGGLACCSPWGHKELDTTERLTLLLLECYDHRLLDFCWALYQTSSS